MKRVVVIDDEKYVRQGIVNGTDWRGMDCEVTGEAANGREGYDLIRREQPDLVVCDVRMPVMDGLEMAEELRKAGSQAKIIFLTAYADFDYIQKALRLGAVDYILKPFGDRDLEAAVLRLFEKEKEEEDDRILPLKREDAGMNRYVRSAIRYITAHYQEEGVSISTVAEALDVSEGHLSRLFKKDTGMSISTYVTAFRIRKAMVLLRQVQYRVSEVANLVGYTDVAYFSSTFRKLTGMSPSEFQKR